MSGAVLPDRPSNEFSSRMREAPLARGFLGWTYLVGAISFELFGQLSEVIQAQEEYFDHQVHQVAGLIGLYGQLIW